MRVRLEGRAKHCQCLGVVSITTIRSRGILGLPSTLGPVGGTKGDEYWYFSNGHSEFVRCGSSPVTNYLKEGEANGQYRYDICANGDASFNYNSPEPPPGEVPVFRNREQRRALFFSKKAAPKRGPKCY